MPVTFVPACERCLFAGSMYRGWLYFPYLAEETSIGKRSKREFGVVGGKKREGRMDFLGGKKRRSSYPLVDSTKILKSSLLASIDCVSLKKEIWPTRVTRFCTWQNKSRG